eukprot:s1331_g6.t1
MAKRAGDTKTKKVKVEKKDKVEKVVKDKRKDAKATKSEKVKPDTKDRDSKKAEKKAEVKVSKEKSQDIKKKEEQKNKKKKEVKTDQKHLVGSEGKQAKVGGTKKAEKAKPVQPAQQSETKSKSKAENKRKPAIRDVPSRRYTTKTSPETMEPDTRFMTPPEHVRRMSSPSCSQAASETSLAKFEREAKAANMTLEKYLENVSSEEINKMLEEHMQDLVEEAAELKNTEEDKEEGKEKDKQKDKEEDKEEEPQKESTSSASDDEESVETDDEGSDDDDDDDKEDGEPLSEEEDEEKSQDSDEEASGDEAASDATSEGIDEAEVDKQVDALVPMGEPKDTEQKEDTKNSSNSKELAAVAERTNKATKKRAGQKAREIMKAYPQQKALDLIKRLRKQGLWAYDEDFDQDEEDSILCPNYEIFYFTNSGATFKREDATSESMAVKASDKGNKELIESLTSEGGPLQAGLLPQAPVANEKALTEAFGDAAKPIKTPKPKKSESTEQAEPKTFSQMVIEKMEACLKKGGEGRRHAIALEAVEYSGDLAKQLMDLSAKMEKVYKKLQDLSTRKVDDVKAYEKLLDIVDDKLKWFEKAEAHGAAAKSLQSGMNPRPKKKAKTTKGAEKPEKNATPDDKAVTP